MDELPTPPPHRQVIGIVAGALRRRPVRYSIVVLASAVVAGLAFAIPSDGQSSTGHRPSASDVKTLSRDQSNSLLPIANRPGSPGKAAPVTLITGNKVQVVPAPGGRSTVNVQPPKSIGSGSGDSFVYDFQVGGDVYSIPGSALSYVGSKLDPRLFDVSYLQRAGYSGLSTLPLSITWQAAKHAAIPGITTPTTGSTTAGSVTMSKAIEFGKTLADGLTAMMAGHPGALAQVKKISLGPVPAPAAATNSMTPATTPAIAPAVPMSSSSAPKGTKLYTLSIDTLDTSGQPAYAVVSIQNLKSLSTYYSVSQIEGDGHLDVSVPAGPYGIEATIYDPIAGNVFENLAFVPVAEVDVTHDTAVTLDSREAKPVTVKVPQDAAPLLASMTYGRTSADKQGLQSWTYSFGQGLIAELPELHLYAKPTPAPRLGTLGFADSWALVPPGSGFQGPVPYTYNLDFDSANGVPTTLSHTLAAKDLATVHENFAQNVPGASGESVAAPFHPWDTLTIGLTPSYGGFPIPDQRTTYYSASPSTVWALDYQPSLGSGVTPPAIYQPYRTFAAGQDATITWGQTPSVPAPEWQSTAPRLGSNPLNGIAKRTWSYVCPACRQNDVMAFNIAQSGDNDPHHSENWYGLGSGWVSNPIGATDVVKFYRDGVLAQTSTMSGQVYPMLPGTASYTIDWTTTLPAQLTQLAGQLHSVWKFRSTRPKSSDRVPSYELCAPDSTQACSFVPLVFASYDFGANLQGQVAAPGVETFTVHGYHQGNEKAPAVTKASVQVSFDDGATWTPASTASQGNGDFRVSVNQPSPSATNAYASVKVSLTDADGNTLDQTVMRAYALAATSK